MKELLRSLYKKNKRDYDVWNYLWLFSDESNSIDFSHIDLCCRFKVPLSSLHRILNRYNETWNNEKIFVEYEKTGYKKYRVIFYPKGKVKTKIDVKTIYDELFDWVKDFYKDKGFDYLDIDKHKRYVKTICLKLEKAMKDKKTIVTDDGIKETFKIVFSNIPDWWVDSGNITLTTINKNLTKILNQIKSNNGTKKRDSYSKAAESISSINYDDLASK